MMEENDIKEMEIRNGMTEPFPKEIICSRNGRDCDAAFYGDDWGPDCPSGQQANCHFRITYPQTIQWVVHYM